MFITATPDDENFVKMLKKLNINDLQREWQTKNMTPEKYNKLLKQYRSIKDHVVI